MSTHEQNIIIFDFIHSMDRFWMQGNIKIMKSTEWAYTIIVKKLSNEKNCKIRNISNNLTIQNETIQNETKVQKGGFLSML